MSNNEISKQLLQQRIRNRIIEYLEIASSAAEQRDYERSVPIAHVPNEMINMWEDLVRSDDLDWYGPPVFSLEEHQAVCAFHDVWDMVASKTPNPMPHTIELLLNTPLWDRLMAEATAALAVFERRGRFGEETEERFD